MRTICVAGLYINIESADEAFFSKRFKAYEAAPTDTPDMVMTTRVVNEIPLPQGEICYEKNNSYVLKTDDGRFFKYSLGPKSGKVVLGIDYSADYSSVNISLIKGIRYEQLAETEYEYMYTGFMFANRLSMLNGTVLHGSSFAFEGESIVFSANSGTGKSTHVGLWQKRFGEKVEIINDDKPAIRIENGKAFIYGTPWSGKTDLNQNVKYPLKAVVFLSRGEENTIKKMDVINAVLNFSNQLPRTSSDRDVCLKSIDFIKQLYKINIPVYDFKCNITDEAVEVAYNGLFKGELQ